MFRIVVPVIIFLFISAATLWASDLHMPGAGDRCPVCGMFVAPYPEWIATIVQPDGTQLYFDGCKDMFRYYFNLAVEEQAKLQGLFVTEYYQARLTPAREVFYVKGSDVYGPMGKELIAVAGRKNAESFMQDHNGLQILTFDQLALDTLPED